MTEYEARALVASLTESEKQSLFKLLRSMREQQKGENTIDQH